MTNTARIALCLAAALASTACSTRPRTFSATVQPTGFATAVAGGEAQAFTTCDQLVRAGHQGNFAAVAASSAATGATLAGGTAAIAASGTIGIGATAAGYALMAALPIVGLAAGFGVNRLIRSGNERKYQRTMSACMAEMGFAVTDWARTPGRQPGVAAIGEPAAEAVNAPASEPADSDVPVIAEAS
jgi:hypothetical protein